jgi:hypothetical protein
MAWFSNPNDIDYVNVLEQFETCYKLTQRHNA